MGIHVDHLRGHPDFFWYYLTKNLHLSGGLGSLLRQDPSFIWNTGDHVIHLLSTAINSLLN